MQSKSLREPLIHLVGADYSAFQRFQREVPEVPPHLRGHTGDAGPFQYTDINLLMKEHFSFADPKVTVGLRIADILVNAVRRAMIGNLQQHGWAQIGRLMVSTNEQVITVFYLSSDRPQQPMPRNGAPYLTMIPHIDRTARQILLPHPP